jgi:hypothetical protein
VGGGYEAEPMRETVLIYHLPNFAQDRRSDLRAQRVKVGSIDDMTRFNELFRAHANLPGYYLQEHRIGGQVAQTKVVEVKPRVETFNDTVTGMTGGQAQHETSAAAQPIVAATEMLRAAKDFAKEAAPPVAAAPSPSPADIQKMIADGIREGLAQQQSTQPAASPVDPFTFVERSMNLQEQMRRQAMASNPAPQQQAAIPDAAESFLSQFEQFTLISERINPIREREAEGRSMMDKIVGVVGDVVKIGKEVAPLAMAIIGGGRVQAMAASMGMADAAPPGAPMPQAIDPAQTPPATPAQPAQPQDENEAMQLIAFVAVGDLIKNKRCGRTADLIEDMAARFPALTDTINQFISMPPESALALLGQFTQRNDLGSFRHARGWIEDLVEELLPADEEDADPEAANEPGVPSIVQMASAQTN